MLELTTEGAVRVLAGTTNGIYSVDGGAARQVLDSRCVRDLVRSGDRLFAGTNHGAFISNDGAETWLRAGLEDRQVWQIRGAGDGALYASTQPAGLFRSDDSGANWVEIKSLVEGPQASEWCLPVSPPTAARARALVIDAEDPRRIWVGVEVGGIMRTADGGDSWRLDLPGDNPDLHMMFAHPARPDVLFASTGYGRLDGEADRIEGNAGVFRSTDGGATWAYVWAGITPRYSRPMCIDPRTPHALTVASAPSAFSSCKDDGGAQAMLFRSDDQGETWRSLCDDAHTPSSANFHGLAPDPETLGGVVIGTDTGEVWRVGNDGEWAELAAGMPAVASVLAI
jgi:hypothetical protein